MTEPPLNAGEPQSRSAAQAEIESFAVELAALRAQVADPVAGFFGPGSAMWHVLREVAVPATGVRAVLLQIAHPLVAAAGAQNSRFMEQFLPRAWRTFSSMYAIMFGDADEAVRHLRRVHALHAHVRGHVSAESSPRERGKPYHANAPDLLLWVLATLTDSSLRAFDDVLGQPLSLAEQEAFWADMRRLGRLFSLSEEAMPRDLQAFHRYMDEMLNGGVLEVGLTAQKLSRFLFEKGWSVGHLDELWVTGLLPEKLIRDLGLPWDRMHQWGHRALRRVVRTALRGLPTALRWVPAYHQAVLRVALARGERPPFTTRLINRIDRVIELPLSLRVIPESHR
jgi:uncharacterized protein (DUF2236 family)